MKNHTYFLSICIALCLFACDTDNSTTTESAANNTTATASPETDATAAPLSKEAIITQIKERFQSIKDNQTNEKYTKLEQPYECESDPQGGKIIYYSLDDKVVSIRHEYYFGDHGGNVDEYYLWEGELFFLFKDESYWTFAANLQDPDSEEPATKDSFTEHRVYINNNETIQCLEKKFEINSSAKKKLTSADFPNKEIACTDFKSFKADYEKLLNLKGKDVKTALCE